MSDRKIIELKFKIERKHGSGKSVEKLFCVRFVWETENSCTTRDGKKSSSFRLNRENEDLCSIWKCAMYGWWRKKAAESSRFIFHETDEWSEDIFTPLTHIVSAVFDKFAFVKTQKLCDGIFYEKLFFPRWGLLVEWQESWCIAASIEQLFCSKT